MIRFITNWMARRAAYKTTYNELSALSDRDLIDLGIHRGMIHEIAYEAMVYTHA